MPYVDADYVAEDYIRDGANLSGIFVDLEYNLTDASRKVEASHRTKFGEMYRHVFGQYRRAEVGAVNVSSASMCAINSLWGATEPVVLYGADNAVIASGYLVNPSAPIDKLMKPYTDLFMGTIELEEF